MKNSSINAKPHECLDSWSAIFCGLVELLIKSNQQQQLKTLLPPATSFAPIKVNRSVELLQQMMRNPNIDLFYTLINQEEATYLMKMFVSTSCRAIAPPVCNKEILQKISNIFKVDTIFLTYNTSISLSNSENLPYVLKVVQFQSKYTVEILNKQHQSQPLSSSRSRSSSQHDYILEMKQECNGCLRQFEQLDLNRSIACSHTYCKQCLKLYFKLGSFFICRDFFCKRELGREDFPFLQLSPLMESIDKIDKCLQCKLSSSRLFTNKCGHTHCEACIRQSLGRAQYFQTHFCLEPACTEIMDNEIVHSNKPEINVASILQRSNSIKQKAADFCQFCQQAQQQGVKNKCNHYYCKQCLQDKYQHVVSFGLSKMIECPTCSIKFNVDTLLEEYYLQLQELSTPRQIRSISQQQPDIQLTPSQTTIRETVTTSISTRQKTNEGEQQSRRQNSMDLKNYVGDSTPRRAMPQTYTSTRGPVSQSYQKTTYTFSRNPQFF